MGCHFTELCQRFVKGLFPVIVALFYFICVNQALSETESATAGEGDTVTSTNNSTRNSTSAADVDMNSKNDGDDDGGSNAGLIAGLIVPIVLVIAVAIALFIIHKRRSRMMDNEKKMKIQMTSARNAGVYQDLTVTVPTDSDKPPPSPEHERLKSTEEI